MAPLSSTNTSRAGPSPASCSGPCALFSATSGRFCSVACSVFFIGQTQLAQPQIHRRSPKRAVPARAQLGARGVGLRAHQLLQAGLAPGGQERFASAPMRLRFQRAPILERLAHPAHRGHTKTRKLRDVAGARTPFVELDDSLAGRKRYRAQDKTLPRPAAKVKLHHLCKCSSNQGRWRAHSNHYSWLVCHWHINVAGVG